MKGLQTSNENKNEYQNKETEELGSHPENERNYNERNNEMELPKGQIDETKETILNELGVIQETDMKEDREILTKIKVIKK